MPEGQAEKLRELTQEQIAAACAENDRWLTYNDGSPADFTRAKLVGVNLRGAKLERADLSQADLTGADLTAANLRGARFHASVLKNRSLRDSDLTDADLGEAVDLVAGQLAGADLTRATLPEPARAFEGLKWTDRLADNARKLYIALLGACAYVVLTIATSSDVKLITNS